MAKKKTVLAFAALATCVFSAHAADWLPSGATYYTVPANTTNEVAQEDFNTINGLNTITFANENSAMVFHTTNYPASVRFAGPGTVIMAKKVTLTVSDTTIRHWIATGGENNFTRYVFTNGINSNNGSTRNLYYFYYGGSYGYGLTNATLYLDGIVTNVSLCGQTGGVNGRVDLGENIDICIDQSIANGSNDLIASNKISVVRQRVGNVLVKSSYFGRNNTTLAAYLLENGTLRVSNGDMRWYTFGRYAHFHQTGGTFRNDCWHREDRINDEYVLPADFIYGGSARAAAPMGKSTPKYIGPFNLVVMDDAEVSAGQLYSTAGNGGKYRHIVAMNGGCLELNTVSTATNVYYAFNGGTLKCPADADAYNVFGNNTSYGNTAWVRIYENGGCIYNANMNGSNNQYLYLPNLKEPVGNVVTGVRMSEELLGRIWQTPPSVEISDSTGSGSNAVAIVDYDFDSGKVTNITVVCRGENYSGIEGKVTANLRYKAGETLLETPLVCTVAPCLGGDVTFAGGKTIYASGITNTYHGATIVDMDRNGEYDHPETGIEPAYHSLFMHSAAADKPHPCFLNSTSVVVRSGCLWKQENGDAFATTFPACRRIGLYGGHFAGWSVSSDDFVVGGECWLVNHNFGWASTLTVPADGTLTVDAACLTNGVTPKLKYGTVNFTSGAKIAVRNWEAIPDDDAYHTLLDLSEVTTVNGTPEVEMPDGLSGKAQIRWNSSTRQLMMRRSRGFLMILL